MAMTSRCACGRPKSPRASTCQRCFWRSASIPGRLPPQQRQQLIERLEAGESTRNLAKEFRVSHQAVSSLAKTHNIDLSSRINRKKNPSVVQPVARTGARKTG